MKVIYMDNAATTFPRKRVVEEMLPYLTEKYGNASSVHSLGYEAKLAISSAREQIASLINCYPDDVIFTSGATESNNWAIKSLMNYSDTLKYDIATPLTEHDSVLESVNYLKSKGYNHVEIPVNHYGQVDPNEFEKVLDDHHNIALASVMYVNNETGVIQDIETISTICERERIVFHTDATQALPHIRINYNDSCIDILSASSHKINGPKGVGILVANKRIRTVLQPFLHGGHQENNKRAGTYNVPGIVGFGVACSFMQKRLESNAEETIRILTSIFRYLLKEVDPTCIFNTPIYSSVSSIISVSFADVSSEELVTLLSQDNICCSSGSACNAGTKEPSHVLEAMEVPKKYINGTLRFSLNETNTEEEIRYVCDRLKEHINYLRKYGN